MHTDTDEPHSSTRSQRTVLTSWMLLLCPDAHEYELHQGEGVLVARGEADELKVGARLDLRRGTYMRVELGDDIVRVQHGDLLPDGSVLRRWDATLDTLCEIETLADTERAADVLPLPLDVCLVTPCEAAPRLPAGDRPGLARARVVTESGVLPAVVLDERVAS